MKTNIRTARGFTLVELLVVIAIIATLAGIAAPVYFAKKKEGDLTEAISYAKQLGIALFSFETDYGRFPDDDSVADLGASAVVNSGSGSNAYFSQLIAAGYCDQEAVFYCKTDFTTKPDNDMSSSSEILKAGEVGFSYVMRSAGEGLNTSVNSAVPIVTAPYDSSGGGDTYSQSTYNKKAVVLRIDTSVTTPRIDDDGIIRLKGNKDLFDTATGSVWEQSGVTSPAQVHPET